MAEDDTEYREKEMGRVEMTRGKAKEKVKCVERKAVSKRRGW